MSMYSNEVTNLNTLMADTEDDDKLDVETYSGTEYYPYVSMMSDIASADEGKTVRKAIYAMAHAIKWEYDNIMSVLKHYLNSVAAGDNVTISSNTVSKTDTGNTVGTTQADDDACMYPVLSERTGYSSPQQSYTYSQLKYDSGAITWGDRAPRLYKVSTSHKTYGETEAPIVPMPAERIGIAPVYEGSKNKNLLYYFKRNSTEYIGKDSIITVEVTVKRPRVNGGYELGLEEQLVLLGWEVSTEPGAVFENVESNNTSTGYTSAGLAFVHQFSVSDAIDFATFDGKLRLSVRVPSPQTNSPETDLGRYFTLCLYGLAQEGCASYLADCKIIHTSFERTSS